MTTCLVVHDLTSENYECAWASCTLYSHIIKNIYNHRQKTKRKTVKTITYISMINLHAVKLCIRNNIILWWEKKQLLV